MLLPVISTIVGVVFLVLRKYLLGCKEGVLGIKGCITLTSPVLCAFLLL